jgi:hypothetical protein
MLHLQKPLCFQLMRIIHSNGLFNPRAGYSNGVGRTCCDLGPKLWRVVEEHADFTLTVVDPELEFKAHQCILVTHADWFRTALTCGFKETSSTNPLRAFGSKSSSEKQQQRHIKEIGLAVLANEHLKLRFEGI